jgi:HEPN domain-containing protein
MVKKKDSASSHKSASINARRPISSPLIRSAFEVLEHGLWHFLRSDTTTDMKFALLHIDQAIELFLKELVRKNGHSIYKNPKETISIWGAYEILENKTDCRFPEKPDLELLHEERNNIQHKYSNPNSEDAAFHVANAMKFIERITRDELGLALADFLPSDFLSKVL